MERHLVLLLFITGVSPYITPEYLKYILVQQPKSWHDAQAYCRSKYIDLVTLQTADELFQVHHLAQVEMLSSLAWVGLYDDVNSWRWSMGNQSVGSFTPWVGFNPDNYGGVEHCGAVVREGWIDASCDTVYPFLCYDGRYTGASSYIYYSTSKTWVGAQSYCRQFHTDLASARDGPENSMVVSKIINTVWIGLIRDTWKWTGAASDCPIPWAPTQPNNANKNENCGAYDASAKQFHDSQCTDLKPFFCYGVITSREILRVKVRSDQDVNDSAVKAELLQQIKSKLKEHNLEQNVTLKWREQPEGPMFKKLTENDTIGGRTPPHRRRTSTPSSTFGMN